MKEPEQGTLFCPDEYVVAGPVECLGMAFENDQARREYFTEKLREKLKDPEFRKIEGFPIGEDEDILAMSDPPYYTACPNPWLGDFVKCYGKPYNPKEKYHREPLAIDVSVGKTDALYRAHSYHTKVPHLAIVPSILHYTEPGDIVFDAFAGSGMTGVAAQWCGVAPPDYRAQLESQWKAEGRDKPEWGMRRAILNDLSPAATFIAANYNLPFDVNTFASAARGVLDEVETETAWLYETLHSDGRSKCLIDYTVWSEVCSCPECAGEIVFLEEGLDPETKRVKKDFPCPHCSAVVTKRSLNRVYEMRMDARLNEVVRTPKREPVLLSYHLGKNVYQKRPDESDRAVLEKIPKLSIPMSVPGCPLPYMHMTHERARMDYSGVTHVHHFFLPRAAYALGLMWEKALAHEDVQTRRMLLFFVEQAIWSMSVMNKYEPIQFGRADGKASQVGRYMKGIYYVASSHTECRAEYVLGGKLKRMAKAFRALSRCRPSYLVSTGDAACIGLPNQSVDYVFTDPPFGENIYYADLNFLVESWHGVKTQAEPEAIIDRAKKKALRQYHDLMRASFAEYYRVLKPGRWMTVVFSNSRASVWNSIQTALQETGFVVASVSALDKQQGSYRAVTSPTAVKQDLVISAYKPSGQLELNFEKRGATEEGVWDFIREHLGNLPVVKAKGGQLEFITERDPRILYDRTVAFYVRHGVPVPLSSPEFQASLADRFSERDGMYFLPEQAAEYDRKRIQMEGGAGQMTFFVEDERSAVDWLRGFLKDRPSKYQDIQPEFFEKLNESWKKWETRPELQMLLDQYFLCYHGEGDIPPQIHSYLSTNFKDMRNLPADNPELQAKARDRWFVPDPRKNADVEQLREKRLLDEFWRYVPPGYDVAAAKRRRAGDAILPGMEMPLPKLPKGKRLKEVRIEAVRIGFQHCFKTNDYPTIIAVSRYIPEDVIENDDQLQMIVDAAMMRSGLDE